MYSFSVVILGYRNNNAFRGQSNLDDWLKVHGLAGWLETATEGLANSAKERVSREIESHYAESVSAHVEAGLSKAVAKETALSELGNPQIAARNFKTTDLTKDDVKWIDSFEELAALPFFSSRTVSSTGYYLWLIAALGSLIVPGYWLLGILALLIVMNLRVMPRLMYLNSAECGALVQSISRWKWIWGVPIFFLVGLIHFQSRRAHTFMQIIVNYPFYWWIYQSGRLIQVSRKLKKYNHGPSQLPPQQAASS